MTVSPSIRPGQPRSSSRSRGVNMQSFTVCLQRGSVWTIRRRSPGARAGCAPRSRSHARARPRAALPESRPSVRYATSPSSVSRKRSSRGSTPVDVADDAAHDVAASPPRRPSRPAASSASGSRCVCTDVDLGQRARRSPARPPRRRRAPPRARASPGSLRWSETSVPPSTERPRRYAPRARAGRRAPPRARGRGVAASSLVGSTWTTTSALRQRRCTRRLDASAAAWPWPTAAPGVDADDDVRELRARPPAACAAAAAAPAADADDRLPRRLLGIGRRTIHEDVDVAPHQPRGGEQDEHGDEERGDGVGARVAGAGEQQADRARRASRRGRCRSGARSTRARRSRTRAPRAMTTTVRATSMAMTTPMTSSAYQVASTAASRRGRAA